MRAKSSKQRCPALCNVCFVSEYAGHAREMARELLVDKYDGIVIVSGDGLVHEVMILRVRILPKSNSILLIDIG